VSFFSLDLNTERVSQLMTAGGREFQVAGAALLKDRLPISVRLNGTSRNGTADNRSDRVPLRALMCRLRYAGADVSLTTSKTSGDRVSVPTEHL